MHRGWHSRWHRAGSQGHRGRGAHGPVPVLRQLYASAGGAGVRTGTLPSRPAHGADAAPRLPPALPPWFFQPHYPRPQTALPALSLDRQEERPAARKPRSGMLCRPMAPLRPRSPSRCARGSRRCGAGHGRALAGVGGRPPSLRRSLDLFPGSHPGGIFVCLLGKPGQSQLRPRALHCRDSPFANLRNKGCVSVPLAPA